MSREATIDALVGAIRSEFERLLTAQEQANRVFDGMLEDILMDCALQAHRELVLSKRPCSTCATRLAALPRASRTSSHVSL
jgi:hypothetical protein